MASASVAFEQEPPITVIGYSIVPTQHVRRPYQVYYAEAKTMPLSPISDTI